MSAPTFDNSLRALYAEQSDRIRQAFEATGDGRACVTARAALVDSVLTQLYATIFGDDANQFALIAMGGFGRGALFPHSDIDLLFLCNSPDAEQQCKDRIRTLCQELWDLRIRVSPATRTLAECDRLYRDNVEFTIALLDIRYLAGNRQFFDALRYKALPQLVSRELQPLVQRLAEVTTARHAKYGNTIFHLEPNVKECPGGLRDFDVAAWLALIAAIAKHRRWPAGVPLWTAPSSQMRECENALDFLFSARCFLHYRAGRDDNQLNWEAQDEAAAANIGTHAATSGAGDWMRSYYRHARVVQRLAAQLLDEVPSARSSLYHQYQQWRSRVSNADFSVVNGRIFLQQPSAIGDSDLLLRTFEFMALHGFKLSADTERRVCHILPAVQSHLPSGAELWNHLRQILIAPAAAAALRAMHAAGLLTLLLPELEAIDALVIRDFYHRYTVDEHTFLTIDNLHRLLDGGGEHDRRFSELLAEVERPELLYLALLLHDIGKGFPGDHVPASLATAQSVMERLALGAEDRDTIHFLIEAHLEMSATLMRRDIFDPQTVRAFAARIEDPERLKMLCLLTWADIKAVNPEALTPWKAETLWQLYIASANSLERSVDDLRFHRERYDEQIERIHELVHALNVGVPPSLRSDDVLERGTGNGERGTGNAKLETRNGTIDAALDAFLDGLPRRYFLTHAAEEIAVHFTMTLRLWRDPVQVELHKEAHAFRLTLVTVDRPALFATVAGVLFAWGLNIVKADAFSNTAGTVVDTFYATDLFRTLELNPPERERFKRSLIEVLCGETNLERLMEGRARARTATVKVSVETRLTFDNECSSHSTLLEVVAQDRPGLLYRISSTLAETGCNIELALIDTEGQVAIDVFYLTAARAKLTAEHQERVRAALLEELSE